MLTRKKIGLPAEYMTEFAAISGGQDARVWFSKLSEANAASFTEETARAFLDKVGQLAASKEFVDDGTIKRIRASQGDVLKVQDFANAQKCCNILATMAGGKGPVASKAHECLELAAFLRTRKVAFAESFELESMLVTNLYVTMVITFLHSTATLILRGVEYIKLPKGDFEGRLKQFELEDDVVLSNLSSTVANIRNGKMDTFLRSQTKNEAAPLLGPVALTTGVVLVIWVCVHIRDIIFHFLTFRKNVADWANAYADFIEMNAASIAKDQKKVAAKQMKAAERFRKLAAVFDVSDTDANRRAAAEARRDDSSVSSMSRHSVQNGIVEMV